MATLKELRLRVQSLKNTRKITSAMKVVAASKLKRAKDAVSRTRPYIDKTAGILARLSGSLESINNPLLEERAVKRLRFLVFSSDRGLCGGFNNNLLKYFFNHLEGLEPEYDISIIGKKAFNAVRKKGLALHHYYEGSAVKPGFMEAQKIAQDAISDFLHKKVDKVVLVYNNFISSFTQRPVTRPLLPYESPEPVSEDETAGSRVDYIFEPDRASLINELLPKQLAIQVFQALLDNAVGEHAARMTAMDSATNNANDLISSLTVQMNRARQAAITTELTEIISGAEAL